MRVLSPLMLRALTVGLVTVVVTVPVSLAVAHPPEEPDHGVNKSAFAPLWAGDTDDATGEVNESDSVSELAASTDIPLDSPPEAVEQWNDGELDDVPSTGADRSVAPRDASLRDGRLIEDAHASIVAVQPSTRVHLSATETPLYVAPSGSVLGTVDYRVTLESGGQVTSHRVNETRLLVDGTVVARGEGSRAPTLDYADLTAHDGTTHTLTLEATIEVSVPTSSRNCSGTPSTNGTCTPSNRVSELQTEELVVRDSVDVVEHDLSVSGFVGQYPDGDTGQVIYASDPWAGYARTDREGRANGVWRFYSARDTDWDTLTVRNDSASWKRHSPVHPLQVHAFPIEVGPTAGPRSDVRVIRSFGSQIQPPPLPAPVHLDVVEEPYVASYGIATRWENETATRTTARPNGRVTATGLVRGVETNRSLDSFSQVPIRESNLTVTVRNLSNQTVTIRVTLRDTETGTPIETATRNGHVRLAGEQVDTGPNGTVTRTIRQPGGGVTARYEPGFWWQTIPGYTGSSDTVSLRGTPIDVLATLFRFAIPVSLFLLAVFLVDRITRWRIWPPWRT